jgi:glycosyltransferase involved in cell wall biosynthesis
MKRLSICTPCFNEVDNIRRCYEAVRALFDNELKDYEREHIFSDNYSTDGTSDVLRAIAAQDPCVKVILNARNFGIVRSSTNGIFSATGDAVFMFMPADLQEPPALMPQFVRLWEDGYHVVYGIKSHRQESAVMTSLRKLYYRLLTSLSSLQLPMNVSDFQLLDRRVVDAMKQFDDVYPFVRALPFLCSSKTIGVSYTWNARTSGFSKNRWTNLIDQGLNGIISTTHVPTRVALFAGFGISLCSLIYTVINVIGSLLMPPSGVGAGIKTLIAGMFFFNGVVIFILGILGEYVLAIHQQVRRQPRVIEQERLNFTSPSTVTFSPAAKKGETEDFLSPTLLHSARSCLNETVQ